MPKRFKHLLSPFQVGNVTFKNRIMTAPQSIPGSYEGWKQNVRLSYQGMQFFLEKAKGGAGCVTVGEIDVSDDFFQKPVHFDLLNFTTLAQGIRNYGAVASLEIGCRGAKDYRDESPEAITWGPTSCYNPRGGRRKTGAYITAMTQEDMREMAGRYAQAAHVLVQCGFDMAMIHAGHAFLLNQFLSPLYNQRTDEYGGSVENRARFPLMVLRAIREKVGCKLLLELRICADELVEGGTTLEECLEMCRMFDDYVDIIHLSAGSPKQGEDQNMISSVYKGRTPNLRFAETFKQAGLKAAIASVGAYSDPFEADQAVAEGKTDFICISRQSLADPHYAKKLMEDEPEEVNVCIRCNGCHAAPPPNLFAQCTVNPRSNYEFIYPPATTPAEKSKKVLIVGGGPAGMMAAVTAADRGHQVILAEMGDHLGGLIDFSDYDYYKERIARWKENMIRKIGKRNIDVRLNTRGEELIAVEQPEVVIAAVGSVPAVPPIKGIEAAIHVLDMYPMDHEKLGRRIVVIGGGLAGCDAALHLDALGHQVSVVEMQKEFAPDAYPMTRGAMLENLAARIDCHAETRCVEIGSHEVVVESASRGVYTIPADTVVYALGMKSRCADQLRRAGEDAIFVAVGDCIKPTKMKEAIHTAYFAAMSI